LFCLHLGKIIWYQWYKILCEEEMIEDGRKNNIYVKVFILFIKKT